ncbi:MAG: hypothetical protein OEZ01_05085, partial [Candidatus Heimdallarchaeota archaeon]|nr:hypothetical protein [Candidatus Heimdallarchaeota archaeon]
QDDIILHNYSDMVLFRTSKFTIIIAKNVPLPHGVIIRSEYMNAIYISTPLNYFICYTENDEYVVYRKNDKIVIENNRQIQHTQLAIRRLLPYFYLNMKPQLDYCRGDWENGYIIISDNPSNYTFYDIVSFNGSYFTQKQDDKNYYCLIEENGQYCLIWYRGEKYPLGTLQLQNLIDPDQSKITIYNVNKIETGSKEKFLEVEEKEIVKAYPLFLPEWNEIDLWIHYNGRRLYLQKISETIAFLLFDRITLQNNIELLELYEEVSEEYAFLKYGNLNIEYHGNLFHYEGVSPIWLLQKDLGLLITANIDQEAYIWDLNQKIQLPIGNFPVKLPYSFAFANNRRFVAGISFSVNEKIFLSANKNFSKIESEYPIITCHVYDIERKKHFSRNYRFPIKIINKDISIEFIDKTIVFLFPSFIDLDNQTKIIFDTEKNKFSISHLSKHKRYWITHSINSPFNLIQKAEEFPVEPNPEIKREFQMRRSMIADRDLVRKSDQIVIGSIFQGFQLIEQKSNSLLYSDEKTTEIQLPYFYNDIFKPIKVELNMYELFGNDELLNLPNLSEIPILMIGKFDLLRQDEAYLNRLKEGLNYLINLECSHDETGISFSQNKVEIYQSRLELLLEAIDDLLVQFRD